MSSIRTDLVALDTNEYVFALRYSPIHPASVTLVRSELPSLIVHMPLQVTVELKRNLTGRELQDLHSLLSDCTITRSYDDAPEEVIARFESSGARKGDALIAAQLHLAGVRWLVSENRHFLTEITDLPFVVITATEALALLE